MHPVHPKWSAYQGYASTPRQHTVEVSASQGPQQAGRLLSMPCRRCVPSMYMCCRSIQSFVHSIWPDFSHPVLPSTPNGLAYQGSSTLGTHRGGEASLALSRRSSCPVVGASRRCTCAVGPSSRLCFLAITNPRSCWFSLSTVSWR